MTTYRNIHGRSIQAVTTDPTESVAEGQVWYNTTSDTFKSVVNLEAFTSSAPYTTGRRSFGSSGTQTANLIYAGSTGSASNATEEYNGSGWTTGGTFGSSGYGVRGMGTQTAALSAGLFTPGGVNASTYKYDVAKALLAVFIEPLVDQLVPSYSSVAPVWLLLAGEPVYPPHPAAAV